MFQRTCSPITSLTIATSALAANGFNFGNYAGGQVFVPAGSSISVLTWYGSIDGITYLPVQDGAGNAVTSTVGASACCLIPVACFGCKFLLATDSAGGTVSLSLKG